MPGLSFFCDLSNDLREKNSMIMQSLDSMLHFGRYNKKIIFSEKSYFLGYTAYDEYPITYFENDEYIICLEGQIYNIDNKLLNIELYKLAGIVSQSIDGMKDKIIKWMLNTDGDFVVFVLNKKNKTISIINDALGRLPLYYYKNNQTLIISRELRFIKNLINDHSFDRMAMAQYLLFGYSLGQRTLLENIYRFEPASIVQVMFNKHQIDIRNIYKFNVEEKKNNKSNYKENAEQLVKLFNKACKNRANISNGYINILSLSGGLDSRVIGACLKNNNIPFCSTTLMLSDKTNKMESVTANKIAKIFESDWTLYSLDPPKGKDYIKLLKLKNGLNYLGMSSFLTYLDKLLETYGSKVNFFTGDGGDRAMTYWRPYKKLKNLTDLINYIISTKIVIPIDNVSAITNIQKNEIIDELKRLVLSFPEKDFNQKYIHFMIYEDAINWVGEGTDRNRYYYWTHTPLLSLNFFNYAVNCPDEQKAYYKLYRQFLYNLSPQASAVEYANYNAPLMSKKFLLKLFIISKMPRKLKEIIKKRTPQNRNSYDCSSNIVNCMHEQINNCKSICNYLSYSVIDEFVTNCHKYQFDTLFTITSLIDEFECYESTIQKYYESEFI